MAGTKVTLAMQTILMFSEFMPKKDAPIVKELTLAGRKQNLIEALYFDGLIESLISYRPSVTKFLEVWESYTSLEVEDHKQYDEMKKSFTEAFGVKWFESYLHLTYYFHRTHWLHKYELTDTNERPV